MLNFGANGVISTTAIYYSEQAFFELSMSFQNYKFSYLGDSEHSLFHENEYFCNVFVLGENPQF
jgi:hypothetical protein